MWTTYYMSLCIGMASILGLSCVRPNGTVIKSVDSGF